MSIKGDKFVAYVEAALADAPALLRREDVGRVCQVSPRTVSQWVADGKLAVIRYGASKHNAVRVPREALRDFLLERCER